MEDDSVCGDETTFAIHKIHISEAPRLPQTAEAYSEVGVKRTSYRKEKGHLVGSGTGDIGCRIGDIGHSPVVCYHRDGSGWRHKQGLFVVEKEETDTTS
jgi:hypothetical protein